MPERCSPRIAGTFARGVRRFAQEADAVLACSEATRRDTIELLDVPPEKVTVTYEGVDEDFAPVEREEAATEVARAYGVREPYVLFVSTLEPRKNVPSLLRAFAQIAPSIPHRLVLAGGMGWKTEAILAAIREVALGDRLVMTGFVPSRRMLACLYSAADVFAFPTWYEGFGLSILEAMTCGCPVVASDNSSVPEVVGDAGLLCAADDVEGLAGNILRVIEDSSLRNELADRGRARALLFSWEACALKTLYVYRSVLS
jgi:glycosyltransferase involved in cell wall biosynthesis